MTWWQILWAIGLVIWALALIRWGRIIYCRRKYRRTETPMGRER